MPRSLPPHLYRERTRHGRMVWYVRKGYGPRIRIKHDYDTTEFWSTYRAAIEQAKPPVSASAKPGTIEWAIDQYRKSPAWAGLSNATRRQRENIYRKVIAQVGDKPISGITTNTIVASRNARAGRPHSANNFIKAMRGFFVWASDPKEGNLVAVDPTTGIKQLRGKNDD